MRNKIEETKEKSDLKFIDMVHTAEVVKWLYELITEAAKELMPVVIEFLQGLF